MSGIIIKPRARIFHGNEWVYGAEVQKMFGDPQPGDVITLKDFKDRGLGSAIFNPKSQIIARRFSRHREDLTHNSPANYLVICLLRTGVMALTPKASPGTSTFRKPSAKRQE